VIVLDTHAWVWWVAAPDRLSGPARRAVEGAEAVGVAAISCWEVAMLALRKRIALDRELSRWIRQALAQPGIAALPITPQIALEAALLEREGFGGDPADRLIYATARDTGATLVTRDQRLREFDPRGTVW
jgi:PIN domain nuclease of toxin-antitoxin system